MTTAIFDLDNTLIRGYSQFYLLFYSYKKGYIHLLGFIIILIWFQLYNLHLSNSTQRIMEYAFRFVKGKTPEEFNKILDDFHKSVLWKKYYPPAVERISYHKENGDKVVIVSNAIEPLVRTVANNIGVGNVIATKLEIIDGLYTGKIIGDVVYGKIKVDAIRQSGISLENSFVNADHYSDLPMFELAEYPVAVNPHKTLLRHAETHNWKIL